MAKINQQPPKVPLWPWGGPRSVRERLVDATQLRRKQGKKGDPKNPALPSAELLDFIGPAHSSEELRLPMPPLPAGHDADLETFYDFPYLHSVADRADPESRKTIERGLARVSASPERVDRLKALLGREAQMLGLIEQMRTEMAEIQRKIREEQRTEGY